MPESCSVAIQEDFDFADYFELRQFPTIHLVILGIVISDLETQIKLSTDPIDSRDWQGRTALSWAAAKGDLGAVELLLDRGADPNISSLNGSTPLMFASRAPNASCIRPLLAKRARPNDQNLWQVDALNYAMRVGPGTQYILPLLQGGADVNGCDPDGFSALMRAVKSGHHDHVACLIRYGARPREQDGWISGLLKTSIHSHDVITLSLLLANFWIELEDFERDEVFRIARDLGDEKVMDVLQIHFSGVLLLGSEIELEEINEAADDLFFDSLEVQEKQPFVENFDYQMVEMLGI